MLALRLSAQEPTLVIVSASGKALAGVEVFLSGQSELAKTDANGSLEIPALDQKQSAWFFKPGFAYHVDTISPGKKNLIELKALSNQLKEVVVSDFQTGASLSESVMNVRKIGLEQIEAQSAQNIEQALAHQAFLRSSRDNALNMNNMTVMGLGGENIKVLVDGVPMIGRMLGNLDLSEVSSNAIESIEIIEGPMSVIYGSNALAGAVNIITKSNLSSRNSLKIESHNTNNGTHNIGASFDKGFGKNGISLSGGRNFFQGWNASDLRRGWTWLPKEQYYGNFKYSRQTKNWMIDASSRLSHAYLLDRGEPILPYGEQAIDREFRRVRADQLLNAEWNPQKKLSARIMLHQNYFSQVKNTFAKDLTTLEQQLTPVPADQDTQRFHAEGVKLISNYVYSEKTKFLLGFDANQERLTGPRIKDGIQSNSETALYASYEQRVKTMDLRFGLRKGLMNQNWTPWIFALQARVPITSSLIMRASYGRAYRIASIKERYLNFVDSNHEVFGNDQLQPEDGDSYQLKFTQLLRVFNVENSLDLSFFYNNISNKIELLALSPLEAIYQNVGSFQSRGMNMAYHLSTKKNDIRAEYNVIGIDFGTGLDYSSRASLQVMHKVPKIGTNVSIFASAFMRQFVSIYSSETGEIERLPQEAYSMIDAQLSKKLFKDRLQLTLGARNLFNVTQVLQNNLGGVHQSGAGTSFISNGRNYFISASFNVFK